MTWIIVGLGNPGKEYENTRHNVGAMGVVALQQQWDFPDFRAKGSANGSPLLSHRLYNDSGPNDSGPHEAIPISLVLPQNYMNLSGLAIAKIAAEKPQAQWLILHDELDLPVGQVRLGQNGGTNGHNGLKSIQGVLGPVYYRLRVGIGRPSNQCSVSDYVLSSFGKQQREMVDGALDRAIASLPLLLKGQIADCAEALKKT